MTFRLESEMTEHAERWMASGGLTVWREFGSPWGSCDMVACALDPGRVRRRVAQGLSRPLGPQMRIALLLMMPKAGDGQGTSRDELLKRVGPYFSKRRVLEEIDRLVKNRFAVETLAGIFSNVDGWLPMQKKLLAMELKLTRIEEVLDQALSNQGFADESWVGLPLEVAGRLMQSARLESFIKAGIGVLAVGQEGCEVLLEPCLHQVKIEALQVYCVERFWRERPKDSSSSKSGQLDLVF